MVEWSRPLELSFAITHVTTLAAYAWRLLGRGCGVKSYPSALCSLATFLTTSAAIITYTKGTPRYVGLVAAPVLALLHFRYCVKPAFVSVKNKAVFVTGCDSGFGRRLALRLDTLGLHVFAGCQFATGDGPKYLKENASENLQTVPLDIIDENSLEKAYKFIKENLKEDEELWCVVNNAGIYKYFGELDLVPVEVIDRMMRVNYIGSINVTKTFLPMIRRCKGRIVNVSSATGIVPFPSLGPYSSTKAALETISQTLRDEMHKWGVNVIVVRPGPYNFPEHQTDDHQDDMKEYLDFLWQHLPEETKDDYGREYLDSYLSAPSFSSDADPKEVIDDLEDAVMSKCPPYVYNPGTVAISALLMQRCFPSCWRRCPFLMQKFTFYFKAIPAALQGSNS